MQSKDVAAVDCAKYLCATCTISFFQRQNIAHLPRKEGVTFYPYPLTTATSLPWPLSSISKVAVVERFNCILQTLHPSKNRVSP